MTPLEENRSFLEKVQLGELLAGVDSVAAAGSSAATSSAALFQLAAAAASLSVSNGGLFDEDAEDAFLTTSEDEEDIVRRPAIRWQDTHGHLPLVTTANLNGISKTHRKGKKMKKNATLVHFIFG